MIYFPVMKVAAAESLIRLQGLHSREDTLLCIGILQGFRSKEELCMQYAHKHRQRC
jgi:hypothetical protein